MSTRKLISLCMIALNEEEYLPRALGNLDGFWNELIVVVDSRTTDRTAEIAKAHGATVLMYEWQAPGHLAEMRNMGLDIATGEWIVALDADEIIIDHVVLRKCLERADPEVVCVWPLFKLYDDNGQFIQQWQHKRIWRNGYCRFRYRHHEYPITVITDYGREETIPAVFEHRQPSSRDPFKKIDGLPRLLLDAEENPGDYRPAFYLQGHYLWMECWRKSMEWGKRSIELLHGEHVDRYEATLYWRMYLAAQELGDHFIADYWKRRHDTLIPMP